LLPSVGGERVPGLVSQLGHLDVARGVIGEADDPAVILGATADMSELELLDSQNLWPEAS
jgi:hypothetical protein